MDFGSELAKLGPVGVVVVPAVVIAGASIFDALVPTPAEDSVLWYVKKVVSWLAFNIGNAKNAK
jgi:hypothetical protein